MLKESVTVDEVIELLNSALKSDKEAVEKLFLTLVPCNKELAMHETIQCYQGKESFEDYRFGTLGLINGIFGVDEHGYGAICVMVENGREILEFKRVEVSEFVKDKKGDA